jgi:hypothetical protein
MLSYPEHEPIRRVRRDCGARCFRCNAPLVPEFGLRSEGLCTACAEGTTIQWTPRQDPIPQPPNRIGRATSLNWRLRRVAQALLPANPSHRTRREEDRAYNRLWH